MAIENFTGADCTGSSGGSWTLGPFLAGNYIVAGYEPSNSSIDGDIETFVVVP